MSRAETPIGRLSQIDELLRARIIDTRDAWILMGGRPEDAPPAGIYPENQDDHDDDEVDWS